MTFPTIGNQLTLGALIAALKKQEQDEPVRYSFVHFGPTTLDSYRGYYDDLALGYATPDVGNYDYPTVKDLIARLEDARGKTFEGWKGGNFRMTDDTRVWVANPGETGSTVIVGVEKRLYVTLVTDQVED